MSAFKFFGDLSPFQIIVSFVALITGAYTFYKSFIERAKLALYPGDQIGLVVSQRQACHKFHLRCNLVNSSTKMATVHRLEGRIRSPHGAESTYTWHQFFQYVQGGHAVQKSTDPYPLSVPPKNSQPQFIEFNVEVNGPNFRWTQGKYEFCIVGWVNRKSRRARSNLCSHFHIQIDDKLSMLLGGTEADQDSVITIPISEWSDNGV